MKKKVIYNVKSYRFIPVILSCVLLSSCGWIITYIGDKYPPTSEVEVYYSAHDVTKPYRVIGHMSCPNSSTNRVKSAFASYGKKIGADAIVITGTENSKDNQSAVVNADALKYDK
jgi:hypothetical protein